MGRILPDNDRKCEKLNMVRVRRLRIEIILADSDFPVLRVLFW